MISSGIEREQSFDSNLEFLKFNWIWDERPYPAPYLIYELHGTVQNHRRYPYVSWQTWDEFSPEVCRLPRSKVWWQGINIQLYRSYVMVSTANCLIELKWHSFAKLFLPSHLCVCLFDIDILNCMMPELQNQSTSIQWSILCVLFKANGP